MNGVIPYSPATFVASRNADIAASWKDLFLCFEDDEEEETMGGERTPSNSGRCTNLMRRLVAMEVMLRV